MLENIIESCKYVSKNSKYVSINEEKLNQFIEKIENIKWTTGFHHLHLDY